MFFLARAAVCIGLVAVAASNTGAAGLGSALDRGVRGAADAAGQACLRSTDCLRVGAGLLAAAPLATVQHVEPQNAGPIGPCLGSDCAASAAASGRGLIAIQSGRRDTGARPLGARYEQGTGTLPAMPNVDDIIANFEILDELDDRYRYLIELGRELAPLSAGGA